MGGTTRGGWLWAWWVVWGLVACAPRPSGMVPDLMETVQTEDGWRLPVRRYGGEGPPVVLLHGLAASGHTFDLTPTRSLVPGLVADGWDVWVVSLRGDDGTTRPSRTAWRAVAFDDHRTVDLPAILDHIEGVTGHSRVAWVGHSMGGTLMYAVMRDHPGRIGVGVALSSPGRFADAHRLYGKGVEVSGDGRIGIGKLGRFAASVGLWRTIERRVSVEGALGKDVALGVGFLVGNDTTRALLRRTVHWVREGVVTDDLGQDVLSGSDVPLLVVGGPADGTVAYADIAAACDVFTRCTFVAASRAAGWSHDYGHTDTILGRAAPLEVFPRVRTFLDRHRDRVADREPGGR